MSCNCGHEDCGCEDFVFVTLEDDNGNETQLVLDGIYEVGEKYYAVLCDPEQLKDETLETIDYYLFRAEQDGEEWAITEEVNDEDEFEQVMDAIDELLDDEEFDATEE